jgi:multiple sugar transport system permease protein
VEQVIRRKKKIHAGYYLTKYIVMLVIALFLIFPYVFMVSKSFMTIVEANAPLPMLFPKGLNFKNYTIVVSYLPYIGNTLIIMVVNAVFIPLTAMMVAFPFSRHEFKGKKVLFAIMMVCVMIPGAVMMVPTYIMFARFGLVDNIASQWVTAFWGGGGTMVFLIMQFMRSIPKDFDDAAYIDGANKFHVFAKIMLPMCANIYLYFFVGIAIGKWSDFMGPLIYLTTKSKFTLAVAFYYEFSSSAGSMLLSHYMMAMAVSMTLLPIIVHFTFQRKMIGAIKIGGIKG